MYELFWDGRGTTREIESKWLGSGVIYKNWSSLVIRGDVAVKESIKILGVHLNPTLSMDNQVKASIKACNYHIRALRHVRRGLTLESAKLIALGLVTSRLDCCNSLLYGTSNSNLNKLQRVQHCRVILRESCSKHLGTPARGPCSNSFTGSRFSKGSFSRWRLSHSTWDPPSSLPISTVSWRTTRHHGTWGLRDNIFFGFLSGSLRQPDVVSVLARQPFGTVSIPKLERPTHSSHSRHV